VPRSVTVALKTLTCEVNSKLCQRYSNLQDFSLDAEDCFSAT